MRDLRFLLFDNTGMLVDDSLPVLAATRKQSLGDEWSDTLNLDVASSVAEKGMTIVYRWGGEWLEFRVTSPDEIREDSTPQANLQCVNSVQELALTRPIIHFHETNVSALTALDACVTGTRWTVGHVDSVEPVDELELSATNGWDALAKVASAFGLEIVTEVLPDAAGTRIASRTISLVTRRGSLTGRRFEYGADLEKVRRTWDAQEVYSRIIPLGKDQDGDKGPLTIASVNQGANYLDSEDAGLLNRWGIPDGGGNMTPATLVVSHTDIDDPGALKQAGYLDLDAYSQPKVTYEATVDEWKNTGVDVAGLALGDTVQIVDHAFTPSLRLEGRVAALEEQPLSGVDATVVTLGSVSMSLSQRQTINDRTTATVASGKPVWDAASGLASSAHTTAQTAISDVTQVGQVAQAANQTAEAANALASQAQATVAQVGTVKDVTFPVADFADNACTITVAELGAVNLVSPYDPSTELVVWDKCKPIFTDHSMQSAVPEGSIRCTCSATPEKDLRVRVTVLRGA